MFLHMDVFPQLLPLKYYDSLVENSGIHAFTIYVFFKIIEHMNALGEKRDRRAL